MSRRHVRRRHHLSSRHVTWNVFTSRHGGRAAGADLCPRGCRGVSSTGGTSSNPAAAFPTTSCWLFTTNSREWEIHIIDQVRSERFDIFSYSNRLTPSIFPTNSRMLAAKNRLQTLNLPASNISGPTATARNRTNVVHRSQPGPVTTRVHGHTILQIQHRPTQSNISIEAGSGHLSEPLSKHRYRL